MIAPYPRGAQDRSRSSRAAPGHARSVDLAHATGRTRARPFDRQDDRTQFGGCAAGGAGVVVSRAPSTHQARLDLVRSRNVGEQPPGEVLPLDAQGETATRRRDEQMGEARARDCPRVETGMSRRHALDDLDDEIRDYLEHETADN